MPAVTVQRWLAGAADNESQKYVIDSDNASGFLVGVGFLCRWCFPLCNICMDTATQEAEMMHSGP